MKILLARDLNTDHDVQWSTRTMIDVSSTFAFFAFCKYQNIFILLFSCVFDIFYIFHLRRRWLVGFWRLFSCRDWQLALTRHFDAQKWLNPGEFCNFVNLLFSCCCDSFSVFLLWFQCVRIFGAKVFSVRIHKYAYVQGQSLVNRIHIGIPHIPKNFSGWFFCQLYFDCLVA